MCGIIAYTGKKSALPILIQGLQKLEYRGYDSAGVALLLENKYSVMKSVGYVENLSKSLSFDKYVNFHLGIAHTRWATHGEPNEKNTHPQVSADGNIAVVHNGIIENYEEIKALLISSGVRFSSDTDTEAICNEFARLISFGSTFKDSLEKLVKNLTGRYAFVMLDKHSSDLLLGARNGSPMVVGKNSDGFFLASDGVAISDFATHTFDLPDKCFFIINPQKLEIFDFAGKIILPKFVKIKKIKNLKEQDTYDHHMCKEIYEQPSRMKILIDKLYDGHDFKDENFKEIKNALKKNPRITIIGCGSAFYSGLIAKYWFETLGIDVGVEIASEFRYFESGAKNDRVYLFLSQSGETADTLACVEKVRLSQAFVFAIINRENSSMSKLAHVTYPLMAGTEIAVASTKAFTQMLLVLFGIYLALSKGKNSDKSNLLETEFQKLPQMIAKILPQMNKDVIDLLPLLLHFKKFFYLGRQELYPIALEGALKLKEIAYVSAEGLPAGELKHGPLALVDSQTLCIVLANSNSLIDKIASNIKEIKARGGKILLVVDSKSNLSNDYFDFKISLTEVSSKLSPVMMTLFVQIFSYEYAKMMGREIDKPKNLAKSVTVE